MSISHIRHFVSYHNPDVLGAGFRTVKSWSVLVHKRVRDLHGDFVWMVGREPGSADHFLFGRFRVDADGPSDSETLKYRISGKSGLWFKPAIPLDTLTWFPGLRQKFSGVGASCVAVTDDEILNGLRHLANPPAAVAVA